MLPKIFALIVAAGEGRRFNAVLPKQFMPLHSHNISILQHTLAALLRHPHITQVYTVLSLEHHSRYLQCPFIQHWNLPPPIVGGKNRHDSVYCGLKAIHQGDQHPDYILIHDAVRPNISLHLLDTLILQIHEEFEKSADVLKPFALAPILDSVDSFRTYEGSHSIKQQEKIFSVQTPQAFSFSHIVTAHHNREKNHSSTLYRDDLCVFEESYEEAIFSIPGDRENKKITFIQDYDYFFKKFSKKSFRSSQGADIHKFSSTSASPLILGGIIIPNSPALEGHSDADVLLHALTDSLLAAIGAGDIGDHFPPSHNQWKNKNSEFFVKYAFSLFQALGGELHHVEILIFAQTPQLTDYKLKIRQNIARMLNIPSDIINIAATTTEKLGFIGEKKGIAVLSSLNMEI